MAAQIRITIDCDGLSAPHPDGTRLFRFGVGAELPLLREDDRSYYKVAYQGQPAFVPKACSVRLDGAPALDPPFVTPTPAAPTAAVQPRSVHARRTPGWPVRFLRIGGLLAGLIMLLTGVGLIIAAAPSVTANDADVSTAYSLGIGGGVLLAVGLGLLRLTFRELFQFAFALSGIVLAIGGIELLILSIPAGEMSSIDVDPARARRALAITGAVLLPLGAGMAVVSLLRWLRSPASRARLPEIARWAAVGYGALLLLAGGSLIGSLTAAAEQEAPSFQDAALLGAAVPLALIPGAILAFHGLTMPSQQLNGPFRFLPAAPLLVLFALALTMGAVVFTIGDAVWLMSSAHASAALLPAFVVIAIASRGGLWLTPAAAGVTHRQLWLALAVGIAVVTSTAALLDGFMAQALSTALLASNGAFDGLRSFDEVSSTFQYPDLYLSRRETIFLMITIVVIIAPVMEEGFKALGVALILPRRPTLSAALTLGVAVGAGFGVTEASLYGLSALQQDSPIAWWELMVLRGGATTMHALNTGLLGMALYFGRTERRYRRAFLLYLAAIVMHGLWNGLAVLAGSRVIFQFESLTDRQQTLAVMGVMAPLAIATLTLLYLVARRAYRESPKLDDADAPPTTLGPQPAFMR